MIKDPDARLPFTVDWSGWLANEGDTATSTDWDVPDGLTQETSPPPTLADGKATVWLSGGTLGQTYVVGCRITTAGGRVDDRTLSIRIDHR